MRPLCAIILEKIIALMEEIVREFHRRFADECITRVLVIEVFYIDIAAFDACEFGVPTKSINIDGEM